MPTPQLPPFSMFFDIIGDSIAIAIVSFVINISMCKLFAKKHKYDIKPNQVRLKKPLRNWKLYNFIQI